MSASNKYGERKWLFTTQNDIRGNLFSKAAYVEDFTPMEDFGGSLLENIMTARDYEKKEPGMFDTDVHYEFTDLIVKTAFFHKEIDKSSETGSRTEQIRKTLGDYIPILFGVPNANLKPQPDGTSLNLFTQQGNKSGRDYLGLSKDILRGSGLGIDPNGANLEDLLPANAPDRITAPQILASVFLGKLVDPSGQTQILKGLPISASVDQIFNEIIKSSVRNSPRNVTTISQMFDGLIGDNVVTSEHNTQPDNLLSGILLSQNVVTKNVGPNYEALENGDRLDNQAFIYGHPNFDEAANGEHKAKNLDKVTYNLNELIKKFEGQTSLGAGTLRAKVVASFKNTLNRAFESIFKDLIREFQANAPASGIPPNSTFGTPSEAAANLARKILAEKVFAAPVNLPVIMAGGANGDWASASAQLVNALVDAFKTEVQGMGFQGRFSTLRESDEARNLWQNVFQRWNELDQGTKDFYSTFLQIQKQTPSGWVELNPAEFPTDISPSDLASYRFNLKKEVRGADRTRFGLRLPKFQKNKFNAVWYTNYRGDHESVSVQSWREPQAENFFKDLYHFVYKSPEVPRQSLDFVFEGSTFRLPPNYEKAKELLKTPYFSLQVDKLIRRRLYALSKAPIKSFVPEDTKREEYIDLIDKNKWFIKNGKFVKVVEGTEVEFGVEDPTTINLLKASHGCYTTLVNAKDEDQCRKYIFNCLLNNDANSLENCLNTFKTEPHFFDVAVNEINTMHPLLALRTLQRFGFRTHTVYDDEAGTQLRKVERVDHWLNNFVKQQFKEKDTAKVIQNNDRLLAYLDLIAQYINANPGILNKSYGGGSEESAGRYKGSDFVKKLCIPARQEPARKSAVRYELKRFKKQLDCGYVSCCIRQQRGGPFSYSPTDGFSTPFGPNNLNPGVNVAVPIQNGGGDITDWSLKKLNNQSSDLVVGGKFIGEIFKGAIQELESRNKSLSKEDREKIEKRIQDLFKSEMDILKTIYYIEEYNRLMDAFKDYSSTILTVDKLTQMVERHNKLQSKHLDGEQYLLVLLDKLYSLVDKENGDYEPLQFEL